MDPDSMDAQHKRQTNGWPPSRREWIGLIVAIALGLFAVIVLGWYGALR